MRTSPSCAGTPVVLRTSVARRPTTAQAEQDAGPLRRDFKGVFSPRKTTPTCHRKRRQDEKRRSAQHHSHWDADDIEPRHRSGDLLRQQSPWAKEATKKETRRKQITQRNKKKKKATHKGRYPSPANDDLSHRKHSFKPTDAKTKGVCNTSS